MAPDEWQRRADVLAADSLAAGDPTAWFDRLWAEGRAGEVSMPWDSGMPHPLLSSWTSPRPVDAGCRAAVVGCGLGADAEFVATLGFSTLGFDVSSTAIDLARERHPDSAVDYRQGDLFALPAQWRRAFELVVDIYTVQALPRHVRAETVSAVADLVKAGGTLLVVMAALGVDDDPTVGPPWPLTRDDIRSFAETGLDVVQVELIPRPDRRDLMYWRAEFRRARS